MRRSTVHTRSDSPLVQRPERPAGRPTEAPNHLHSQSAQQRILQEHVTRVASGEGSSARAVDLHQLQIRPPRGGRLAAGAPASSSPPESAVQPPSGPQARADVEERCHLAAAHEAPRAAAPRAPQPIRLRRAALPSADVSIIFAWQKTEIPVVAPRRILSPRAPRGASCAPSRACACAPCQCTWDHKRSMH